MVVNFNLNSIFTNQIRGIGLPVDDLYGWLFGRDGYSEDGTEVLNDFGLNALVARRLVAGITAASSSIAFTDLSGVTIDSYEGTATPTISGNSVIFSTGIDGTCYELKLSDGTYLPLENSTYDVSGNGNHGTPSGIDLTETVTNTTTGVYSYNLIKGYGYKVDGTTLVQRLDDGSGWADTGVVDERLAGFWHNQAEAWINFADFPIMDKSDTAIWGDAVRVSAYYDLSNTFLWHPSELTQGFISENIKRTPTNHSNKVFVWDSSYEWIKDGIHYYIEGDEYNFQVVNPLVRMQNLVFYDPRKIDPELLKIIKYLDRKGGDE